MACWQGSPGGSSFSTVVPASQISDRREAWKAEKEKSALTSTAVAQPRLTASSAAPIASLRKTRLKLLVDVSTRIAPVKLRRLVSFGQSRLPHARGASARSGPPEVDLRSSIDRSCIDPP